MHGEPHPTYNLGLGRGLEENWRVLNYMVQASILRAQTCIASRARLFPFHSTNQFSISTWRGRVWRLRTSWCERLERNYWISHFHMLHTESDWCCGTGRVWPARLLPTYVTLTLVLRDGCITIFSCLKWICLSRFCCFFLHQFACWSLACCCKYFCLVYCILSVFLLGSTSIGLPLCNPFLLDKIISIQFNSIDGKGSQPIFVVT